jgi:hypothetical protein
MVSSVYLFFFGGFYDMGHTNNVQMRKCTNNCSRLIDLLNKISYRLVLARNLCLNYYL